MLFFLLACTSTDSLTDVLDDVDAAAAGIDTLVSDHVAAVTAAASLDDVATAESDYAAAWPAQQTAMADAMDMMGKCAMDEDDGVAMDDAMMAMDTMDAEVTAHGTAQAACATVEDCVATETTHQAAMTAETDTIRAGRTGWEDGTMECVMDDMAGM